MLDEPTESPRPLTYALWFGAFLAVAAIAWLASGGVDQVLEWVAG